MADNNNQNQANTEPDNGGTQQTGGNGSDKTYTQQELDRIVNERTGRATKSALSSFFQQKGLSEDEANSAIAKYLDDKKKNTPDPAQLQAELKAANAAKTAAVINQAATLEAIKQGVDTKSMPYLLKMADFSDVVGDDGNIDAEKLTGAIETVLKDIPALKGKTETDGKGGITRVGGDGEGNSSPDETDSLRRAFGLKSKK